MARVSKKQMPAMIIRIRAGSTNQASACLRSNRSAANPEGIFRWSQLYMTDVPAQVAGVSRIVAFVPDRIPNCLQPQSCSALKEMAQRWRQAI